MLKYFHGIKNWDAHFTVPTYPEPSRRTFDFYFKVMLPKANKERVILERDVLGRIVHSKPSGTSY